MTEVVAATPGWFVLLAFLEHDDMTEFSITKHPVVAWALEEYSGDGGFGAAPITIGDAWRHITRDRDGRMCPYAGAILMPDGRVLEGSNAHEDDEFGAYRNEDEWRVDAAEKALQFSALTAVGKIAWSLAPRTPRTKRSATAIRTQDDEAAK